jgi:hypothetical protein
MLGFRSYERISRIRGFYSFVGLLLSPASAADADVDVCEVRSCLTFFSCGTGIRGFFFLELSWGCLGTVRYVAVRRVLPACLGSGWAFVFGERH